MGTIGAGDIYAGRRSVAESVNTGGSSAKVPTRNDFQIPVLSNVGSSFGLSLPALLVLGVIAFWLIQKYD